MQHIIIQYPVIIATQTTPPVLTTKHFTLTVVVFNKVFLSYGVGTFSAAGPIFTL